MILESLLLFYLNIYLSIAVTIDLRSDKPTVLLQEGESMQILCPYSNNYQFFYPNSSISSEALEFYENDIVHKIDKSVTRIGVFERRDTVYGDTGWYGCVKLNITGFNYETAKVYRVYVYIQSLIDLFVNQKDSIGFLHKETGDSVTFPCRPTSPNYTVELLHDENMLSINERVRFDPREGFSISNLTIRDNGHYLCRAKNFDNEQEVSFSLYITSKMKKINQPIIANNHRKNYVVEGQDLQLNCSVEIDSNILYSLNWSIPNENKFQDTDEQYFENSLGINFHQKIKQLIVKNISKEDQGEYECCIESNFLKKCAMKFITVEDPSFEYLKILSADPNVDYIKNCNDNITWIVEYDSYPQPEIKWIHPKSMLLQTFSSNEYDLQITDQKVLLIMKSLSELNSGIHKLIFTNRMYQKTIPFNLIVNCN